MVSLTDDDQVNQRVEEAFLALLNQEINVFEYSPNNTITDLLSALQGANGADANKVFQLLHRTMLAARVTKSRLDALQTKINSLNAEHTERLVAINNQLERIPLLEAELKGYREALQMSGSHSKRRSPEHPDPDKFDGTHPSKLNYFLQEMAKKMNQNSDWWDTEQGRMIYFTSRLAGNAHGQIEYAIQPNGSISLTGVEEIVNILKAAYGDANEQHTAQTELMKPEQVQGARPLAEFLPAWQILAAKSGFGDTATIAHLRDALHPDLQNRLSFTPIDQIPKTLVEFITFLRGQEALVRSANPSYFKAKVKSSTSNTSISTPASATPADSAGDPMDLSMIWTGNQGGTRKPKNDVERAAKRLYCIKNGLCHWCESKDHVISDCPTAPMNRNKKKEPEKGNA
jgi:hypothetical protein